MIGDRGRVREQSLEMPPGVRLEPLADWNRFFGTPGDDEAWRRRLDRFLELAAPAPMRWLEDLEVTIRPGDQISQALYTSGLYEPCTASALHRLLQPGDTFVDVGANVGLFTLLASRWVGANGRVVSVEPSAREFARLRAHIERNGLTNVEAWQVAAGGASGAAVLHVAEGRYPGLNTLEPKFMYAGIAEERTERVTVVALDELLLEHHVGRVTAIKVDVEGMEAQVVSGARGRIERDRPALIVEVAGPALEPSHEGRRAMEGFLAGLGYGFAAIDGRTATVRRVADMGQEAENVIAAPPETIARLITNP